MRWSSGTAPFVNTDASRNLRGGAMDAAGLPFEKPDADALQMAMIPAPVFAGLP
jgi:hypothetical protein